MKKTLFLSLALASCALSATETRLLNGVTTTGGFFDVSKYLVRAPESGVIDSQTCAAVTASNMLAYWYSQHPEATKETVDTTFAEGIYDYIFDYTKNASTTISADCNYYASNHNGASAPAVYTTATYIPNQEGFKVDVTPEGYELTGKLYTSMSLQEAITWGLANNLAMGITMNQTPGKGAHALTIWGGTYESYGVGDPERLTGIYYTNSDNEEGMDYTTFSTSPNADGETEFFFNDGTNRRWKVVELTFLLDPYAVAPETPEIEKNKVYIGKNGSTGDYRIGGAHETATSFWLNGNTTLNIGENMELDSTRVLTEDATAGFRAELTGEGTYVARDFKMGYAKLGDSWSGTVRLTGNAGSLSVETLNSAAVKGSVAELKTATASDWDKSGTITASLKLTNDAIGSAALSITEVSGEKNITFAGNISGTGDMRMADQKGGNKLSFAFEGDVKEWNGSLRSMLNKDSELNVTFKNNKEVNVNVENHGAGKVSVSFEENTIVNGNLLNLDKGSMAVTAADGTTFYGNLVVDTLVVNGQVTIADLGTAQSRSLPSGVTDTEHFNVQEIVFNSGSSLTFSGDFDLSNVSVTLSQGYLDTLAAGSPATLISAAPGSTLSGFATLTNAPTGYELAMENGNLVLKSTSMSDSIDFALASVQLTGNELTLIPMEALPQGPDLGALDVINMAVDSSIINQLFINGADPNALVTLTIGGYKDLTNVIFTVDGKAQYSGEGNGRYRLGNIPEPATATLSLLALAALASRRKRK